MGVTMPTPWVSRHRMSDVIQRRSDNVTASCGARRLRSARITQSV
jgi:hypothetical protein